MNIVIDIGNSKTKIALFDKGKLSLLKIFDKNNFNALKLFVTRCSGNEKVILSSVIRENKKLNGFLKNKFNCFIELKPSTPFPIKNKYFTPLTLGNDRMANVVASANLFPNRNVLVIDTGTCLKFDFIDKKKKYHGGAISPGMMMRYKSLKAFTAKLPLVNPSKKVLRIGNSTKTSIISGVQNGMAAEMDGMISGLRKKYNSLAVILTGGDASFFVNRLKNPIFAIPNLTLHGLNEILNFNVPQNC